MSKTLTYAKQEIFAELDKRLEDGIIEKTNADLIKKLVKNAETLDEAIQISEDFILIKGLIKQALQ